MTDPTPCDIRGVHEHTYVHDEGEGEHQMYVDKWGECCITEGLLHDLLGLCGWKRAEEDA